MSLHVTTTATVTHAATDGCGVHGLGGRVSTPIALAPTAPSQARRILNEALAEWGLGHLADVADLVTSELVTNAVLHGAGPACLTIYTDPDADAGLLFVEVEDAGDAKPEKRGEDMNAEGGRGLVLVEALAEDWGIEATEGGKRVWASISLDLDAADGA